MQFTHWVIGIEFALIKFKKRIQAEFIESPRKAAPGDGEQDEVEVDVEKVEPLKGEDDEEDEEDLGEREVAKDMKEVSSITWIWI